MSTCRSLLFPVFSCLSFALLATSAPVSGQGPYDAVLQLGDDFQAVVSGYPEGSSFLIEAGLHRNQSVVPKQGMTFEGEPGTILSGARLLDTFAFDGTWFYAEGQTQQGTRHGQCAVGYERCSYPEEVFVDDQPLRHVVDYASITPEAFFFDYDTDRIYIGVDPTGRKIETSLTPNAFSGSANNVTIRNLVVEKYANPAQQGAISPSETALGWSVENVEARFNHGAGVFLGGLGVLRGSYLHHNGQQGVKTKGPDVLIEDNRIAHNNFARFSADWEAGGSKFAFAERATIRRNWSHDNFGPGLWVDPFGANVIMEHNVTENNFRSGLYFEISDSGTLRFNYSEANGLEDPRASWYWGAGIVIAGSRRVEVHDNFVVRNGNGITSVQQRRGSASWGELCVTDLDVHHNFVTMDRGRSGLVQDYTPPAAPGDCSIDVFDPAANNRFRDNEYYQLDPSRLAFGWQNSLRSFSDWQGFGNDLDGSLAPIPITPPTWSGSLQIVARVGPNVTLQWSGATDDGAIGAYRIYEVKLGHIASTVDPSNAVLRFLDPAADYLFKVEAVDAMGNESSDGPTVSTSADPCGGVPCPATGLTATATGTASIALDWLDGSSDEAGFEIQRSDDSQVTWTSVASLPQDSVSFEDSGLDSSTTYAYRVRSFGAAGASFYSSVASATTDDPPPVTSYFATSESTNQGTRVGSFSDTLQEDGVFEELTERTIGGNPAKARSRLDHTWTIPVEGQGTFFLALVATASDPEDGDRFTFSYSLGGAPFVDILTIEGPGPVSVVEALPQLSAGELVLQVVDTDSGQGNSSRDTLAVDFLAVQRVEGSSGPTPAPASNLAALALSDSSIELTWSDNSNDELGFRIERQDGADFIEVGQVAADVSDFIDVALDSSITYVYRVVSFNAAGSAQPSEEADATTLPGSDFQLVADGYKQRGFHFIDLSWSSSAPQGTEFEIFRDGSSLVVLQGSSYTDETGRKGGATYRYQVCIANGGECSNEVTVDF